MTSLVWMLVLVGAYHIITSSLLLVFEGNWVQLIIFVGICIGWVSTYVWRVATKVRGGAYGWAAICTRTALIGRHPR